MAIALAFLVPLVAGQGYDDPVGTIFPTPTVESNCFQDNLEDNQIYYQTLNKSAKTDMFAAPCTNVCDGHLQLFVNKPCIWAAGKATMTVAPVIGQCKWAMRNFHWHDSSDEWSYMATGVMQIYLHSPNGLPWGTAINTVGPGGVWFFPRGWPHAFVCVSDEPCDYILTFNGPQGVAVNDHMMAEMYAYVDTPTRIAAYSIGMTEEEYLAALPSIKKTAPDFMSPVDPAQFKWLPETTALPAAVNRSVEVQDTRAGLGVGIQVFNIRQSEFPFATRMSQQRIVFEPCGFRSLVWPTNAAATMTVIKGMVDTATQGGISGGLEQKYSSKSYGAKNLTKYESFYYPVRRAYWIQESTCSEPAEVIIVFEVGNWADWEARRGFGCANGDGAGGVMKGLDFAHQAALGGVKCPGYGGPGFKDPDWKEEQTEQPSLRQSQHLRHSDVRHHGDGHSLLQTEL